jgi:hypothetical protein
MVLLHAEILPVEYVEEYKQQLLKTVTWRLDPRAPWPGDTLWATGPSVQVNLSDAFRTVVVVAALFDPVWYDTVYDTAWIFVKPGGGFRVSVEHVSETAVDSMEDILPPSHADSVAAGPLDSIVLGSLQQTMFAYAAVRDRNGNFVRLPANCQCRSLSSGVFAADTTPGRPWEIAITRISAGADTLVVWEPGLVPDTVRVVVRTLTGVRPRTAARDMPLGITEITAAASPCRLAVGVTVPHGTRSLRVEVFDVTGKLVGRHSLTDPHPGQLSVAMSSGVPARGVCLVRVSAVVVGRIEAMTRKMPSVE